MIQKLPCSIAVLSLCSLAACAVGPDFKPPPAPPGAGFAREGELPRATAAAPGAGGAAQKFIDGQDIEAEWWKLFKSPEINALIERAIAHNPSLEAAQASLRQANENLAAQRGTLFPSVTGQYDAERARASGAQFGLPTGGSGYLYTLNSASVNVTYTLDLFGGVRRQLEDIQAQADYERFAMEASYLALTANVVTAAIAEASLREQIAATEEIARAQRQGLDITAKRLSAGGASRADLLQQQSILQATLATLPALRSQLAQQRNLLATYVGVTPAQYDGAAIRLDALTLPTDLPVSLPSKFVEQRPDVRQYSAALHEATALIGVATANMLPQLTLSGSYGGAALSASDLFSASSTVWTLIGSVTQPLFKGGQLLHQKRAAVAQAQAAAANYQATVLTAFRNVSDTLAALAGDADALAAENAAERAAAASLELTQAQYKAGGASFLQVLTAQQTYQSSAIALIKARAQRYADTAALFQALGGGWWNRDDLTAHSSASQGSP